MKRISWTIVVALLVNMALGVSDAKAQAKKSDAVVKIKTGAGKPNADGTVTVTLTLTIDKGWHIYANPVGLEDLADTTTELTVGTKAKAVSIDYPPGKLHKDRIVGNYKIWEDKAVIKARVHRDSTGAPIPLTLKFQACSDSRCLLPALVKLTVR